MSRWLIITVVMVLLLGLIGLVVGAWVMAQYNGFVAMDEKVTAQWSEVETNYQRRMDLIPNLVETVKGVAGFEKETFTAVAQARARAGEIKLSPELLANPQAFGQFQQAQGALGSALSRLLVTIERYPELKANQNFLDLQNQLEGTENRIAVSRKRYNDVVRDYNTRIRRFPGRMIAGLFGFASRPYFEAQQGAEQAPKVEF